MKTLQELTAIKEEMRKEMALRLGKVADGDAAGGGFLQSARGRGDSETTYRCCGDDGYCGDDAFSQLFY